MNDDTVILLSDKSLDSLYSYAKYSYIIEHIVKDWFDNNLLELNLNKSNCLYNVSELIIFMSLNICSLDNFQWCL